MLVPPSPTPLEMSTPTPANATNAANATPPPLLPLPPTLPPTQDPENFFVVSSDFCHWGSRFRCTPFDQKTYGKGLQIWEYISAMDHEGMDIIEAQDARG